MSEICVSFISIISLVLIRSFAGRGSGGSGGKVVKVNAVMVHSGGGGGGGGGGGSKLLQPVLDRDCEVRSTMDRVPRFKLLVEETPADAQHLGARRCRLTQTTPREGTKGT